MAEEKVQVSGCTGLLLMAFLLAGSFGGIVYLAVSLVEAVGRR
jgi:hypothetical protein